MINVWFWRDGIRKLIPIETSLSDIEHAIQCHKNDVWLGVPEEGCYWRTLVDLLLSGF